MQVPVELQDEIIDHLGLDERTLKQCALVCRSWVNRSRFHLFVRVRVGEHTGPRLLELMDSPQCTVASHVKSLTLTESSGQRWRWLSKGLERLLPVMKLQSLTLQNICWKALDLALLEVIGASCDSLINLHLSHVYFQSFADFLSFISAFPSLKGLVLSVVWYGSSDFDEPQSFSSSRHVLTYPQLETVDLNHCPLDHRMWTWLKRVSQAGVHTVQFWDIAESELGSVNRLLEMLGDSLQHTGLSLARPSRDRGTSHLSSHYLIQSLMIFSLTG
jgi:hypothetical protein